MIAIFHPEDGLALITLDSPSTSNALTVPVVRKLREAISDLASGGKARVLILTGTGRHFCAGLDLKSLQDTWPENPGPLDYMALQEEFAGLVKVVATAPFPVIAAMQGAVVGAGMGIAAAADIRVADPTVRFLIGSVKLGLSAGECGISYHLPQIVGSGRATEIMLTGRPIGADEALRIGLITGLSAAGEVEEMAFGLGRDLLLNSPYAIKHTKQIVRANVVAPSLDAALELENHVQCLALCTSDFAEAATAFVEKRAPAFKGR